MTDEKYCNEADYKELTFLNYHNETVEKMVAYRALYEDSKLWCRPYDMFLEEVNKNSQKYRFELQDIESKNEHYK